MSFSTLNLSPELLSSLPAELKTPTKIQLLSIPELKNRRDLLAIAPTGSGKTYAYGLPLLDNIYSSANQTGGVILVPTRELASQVHATLHSVAIKLNLTVVCMIGGTDKAQQRLLLNDTPDVIIATPGRLLELLLEQAIPMNNINQIVLDEADRLLDMGFWEDVKQIITRFSKLQHTSLFSATFSDELKEKAQGLLVRPKMINANSCQIMVDDIEENLYLINKGAKANALIHLLRSHDWEQLLVFINAKDNADALCKKLNKAGITALALHGNKDQSERTNTLTQFKNKKCRVLVATDLLARGVHIDQLPAVVNFDLPSSPEVYIHRIGRTARAGKKGTAISLTCHGEKEYLNSIRLLTQRSLPLIQLDEFPVTDKPSTGSSKRAPRDKQANRRTNMKKTAKQFKGKR